MPLPKHDWYIVVKIRRSSSEEKFTQADLEMCAEEAAESLDPEWFETLYCAFDDGFGRMVRPHWSKEHPVGEEG